MKNVCTKIVAILIALVIIFSNNIYAVLSDEAKELEKEQESNNQKLDEMQEQLEEIEEEKANTLDEVRAIASEIYSYELKIAELNEQIEELNDKIEQSEKEIKEAEQRYDERQAVLEARLIATYESKEMTYLDVLLSSGNLIELISNYYLLDELASNDADFLEQTKKQKEEIELAKIQLEEDKKAVDDSKTELETINSKLLASKKEKDIKVANLTEQEQETQAKLEELEATNQQLAKDILAAEEKYKAELEALQNSQTGTTTGSGYFMTPVSGGYISATSYYSSGKFHGAIDYAVNSGTPVYAAAARSCNGNSKFSFKLWNICSNKAR